MKFDPPLQPAILQQRYKRFLADVTWPNGEALTVHCPNTGSMKNCWDSGWTVYLQDSNNPKRKYRYSWVLAQTPQGEFIGVNTHIANQLVVEAINNGVIEPLADPTAIRQEVPYGAEKSRIDILLEHDTRSTYIEVKSVTLCENNTQGYFPDAVSTRGQKHLRELIALAENTPHRAVLLFCVQHTGIKTVQAAAHIDPVYADLLTQAQQAGVEIMAYAATISASAIQLTHPLEVIVQ
ncbi:MAG: DNA/RNA nuclease SfsA [Gammaproteobacteria bacterium]|nr:DNA/RNA nuclease SfsA [Gammaproteobacteria bacterium]NVK88040.1 DNA/RNA nuclease SfsA [Gammaproteobacteria bacterium]